MELNEGPGAFSDLIGRRVRDRSGRSLGRVYEASAHWEADGTVVLDELLLGRRSLWRRLRGSGPDDRGIPWDRVLEIGEREIVVSR